MVTYATHPDGRTAKFRTIFNHGVRAEFTTLILDAHGNKIIHTIGHPKSNGVTVERGWKIAK